MKKYIKTVFIISVIVAILYGIMAILNPRGFLNRTRIRTDFLSLYDDYLQYSLGDFKLLDSGEDIFCDSTNISVLWWSVEFIDETGKEQTFSFSNFNRMGNSVARHVGDIASEALSNYIEDHCLITLDHLSEIYTRLAFQADQYRYSHLRDYDRLIDLQNGIQLRYFLDAHTLLHEWDFNFRDLTISSDSEYTFEEVFEEVEELIRSIAIYLELDSLCFRLLHTTNRENRGTFWRFDQTTDGFYQVEGRCFE